MPAVAFGEFAGLVDFLQFLRFFDS
jgi:hypothetical protein